MQYDSAGGNQFKETFSGIHLENCELMNGALLFFADLVIISVVYRVPKLHAFSPFKMTANKCSRNDDVIILSTTVTWWGKCSEGGWGGGKQFENGIRGSGSVSDSSS